jgi:hypothetical protein
VVTSWDVPGEVGALKAEAGSFESRTFNSGVVEASPGTVAHRPGTRLGEPFSRGISVQSVVAAAVVADATRLRVALRYDGS